MTNVNVSEKGWAFVKSNAKPRESFAKTFDRMIDEFRETKDLLVFQDTKMLVDLGASQKVNEDEIDIKELVNRVLECLHKMGESKEES